MLNVTELLGFAAGGEVSQSTVTYTGSFTDTANATAYTYTGASIGTAAANRMVIVTGCANGNNSGAISSVTIGGVTATINSFITPTGNSDPALFVASLIVASGTTADVVATYATAKARSNIDVYYAYVDSATPTNSASDDDDSNPANVSININAGGFAVGVVASDGGTNTYTWTGLTEVYDTASSIEGNLNESSATLESATAQTALAVTATRTGSPANNPMLVVSWK